MEIKQPVFSIIVPTRNRLDCLEIALTKIKEQSYRNFEVIVVDDGSASTVTENYGELWKRLDNRFLLIFCSRESIAGSGASIVRNYGISIAKGQYIGFCDDDDYWCDSQHLEKAAIVMEKTAIDLYIANQTSILDEVVHRNEWLYDIGPILEHATLFEDTTDTYILSRQELAKLQTFPSLNMVIIAKQVVDAANGFWKQLRYLEDLDLYLRVLDKVESVIYCRKTASIHPVPDRTMRVGLVPSLSRIDKAILWIFVSHHVRANCETDSVRRRCSKIEGESLLNFSEQLRIQGRSSVALVPALQSLLLVPSLGCVISILKIGADIIADCFKKRV